MQDPLEPVLYRQRPVPRGSRDRIIVVCPTPLRAQQHPQALVTVGTTTTPTARGTNLTATSGPTADSPGQRRPAEQHRAGSAWPPRPRPDSRGVSLPQADGTFIFTVDVDDAPEELRGVPA